MLPTARPARGKYSRVATDDRQKDDSPVQDCERFQTVHLSSGESDDDGAGRKGNVRRGTGGGALLSCWLPSKPSQPKKASYTFKEDLFDLSALPAKIFYFCMSFGGGFLIPYLPVYFRKLGLSAAETGFLGSLPSFIVFWAAPLWTALADKYRCLRLVLLVNLLSYVIFNVSLSAIPSALAAGSCLQEDDKCVGHHSTTVAVDHTTAPPFSTFSASNTTSSPDSLYANMSTAGTAHASTILRITTGKDESVVDERQQVRDVLEAAVFMALAYVLSASMHSTADAAVLKLVDGDQKTGESRYGKQRLWGAGGFALGNVISGLWASSLGDQCNNGRYSVHFVGFAIFMVLSAAIAALFLFRKAPANTADHQRHAEALTSHQQVHIISGLKMIFSRPRTAAVFLAVLGLAVAKGMDSFLIWFLKEMCASEALLGWALFMVAGSEVPMFLFSDRIVSRLGHVRTIYVVFALFVVRTGLYSTLQSPYFVLPLELLRGSGFSLLWSCAVQYGRRVASPGMESTMQGILGGIWYGIGSGVGSALGGIVYQKLGPRWLFGLSSLWCLACGSCFAFSQVVIERREKSTRSEAEENVFLDDDVDDDDNVEFDLVRAKASGAVRREGLPDHVAQGHEEDGHGTAASAKPSSQQSVNDVPAIGRRQADESSFVNPVSDGTEHSVV